MLQVHICTVSNEPACMSCVRHWYIIVYVTGTSLFGTSEIAAGWTDLICGGGSGPCVIELPVLLTA